MVALDQATPRMVVALEAPHGYGKTTLLDQWTSRRSGRRRALSRIVERPGLSPAALSIALEEHRLAVVAGRDKGRLVDEEDRGQRQRLQADSEDSSRRLSFAGRVDDGDRSIVG